MPPQTPEPPDKPPVPPRGVSRMSMPDNIGMKGTITVHAANLLEAHRRIVDCGFRLTTGPVYCEEDACKDNERLYMAYVHIDQVGLNALHEREDYPQMGWSLGPDREWRDLSYTDFLEGRVNSG